MILTLDLGTSVTKVGVWGPEGLRALGRATLDTTHPGVGRSEQDPSDWWSSVVRACAEARAQDPGALGAVRAVGSAAARGTLALVDRRGDPHGPAMLWSDRRATAEAGSLRERLGGAEAARRRTGVPLDGAAVAAKLAWLADHQPGRVGAAAWALSPKDLVNWRLTGRVATDLTLAGRSGLYGHDGEPVEALVGPHRHLLPPVLAPDEVLGELAAAPARQLGLRAGIPVVVGAGDRQCEVLGTGASERRPMVSWGTTANVSVPVGARPAPAPPGLVVCRAASGGWQVEGGLSAAGSLLAWLAGLLGRPLEELVGAAAASPPEPGGSWRCRGWTAPGRPGGATRRGRPSSAWPRPTTPGT